MAGLQEIYDDLKIVYHMELHKPILGKKGSIAVEPPELKNKKEKYVYVGIAKVNIHTSTIEKVYPSIEFVEKSIQKKVHKFCTKKITDSIDGYMYKYVKDL